MKIFLDSANINAIERRYETGLIDGVTTNPSLIAKTTFKNARDVVLNIASKCPNLESISIEVHPSAFDDVGAMLNEAVDYRAHKMLTTKLPCTPAGLKVCAELKERGQSTNVTLVFSVAQAILAAKAGATYVSPFIGRLDDVSTDGLALIEEIRLIYDNYGFETQILAASVRHTMHIMNCAKIGADVMTGPLSAIYGLLKHPLTDIGLAQFVADFEKGNK